MFQEGTEDVNYSQLLLSPVPSIEQLYSEKKILISGSSNSNLFDNQEESKLNINDNKASKIKHICSPASKKLRQFLNNSKQEIGLPGKNKSLHFKQAAAKIGAINSSSILSSGCQITKSCSNVNNSMQTTVLHLSKTGSNQNITLNNNKNNNQNKFRDNKIINDYTKNTGKTSKQDAQLAENILGQKNVTSSVSLFSPKNSAKPSLLLHQHSQQNILSPKSCFITQDRIQKFSNSKEYLTFRKKQGNGQNENGQQNMQFAEDLGQGKQRLRFQSAEADKKIKEIEEFNLKEISKIQEKRVKQKQGGGAADSEVFFSIDGLNLRAQSLPKLHLYNQKRINQQEEQEGQGKQFMKKQIPKKFNLKNIINDKNQHEGMENQQQSQNYPFQFPNSSFLNKKRSAAAASVPVYFIDEEYDDAHREQREKKSKAFSSLGQNHQQEENIQSIGKSLQKQDTQHYLEDQRKNFSLKVEQVKKINETICNDGKHERLVVGEMQQQQQGRQIEEYLSKQNVEHFYRNMQQSAPFKEKNRKILTKKEIFQIERVKQIQMAKLKIASNPIIQSFRLQLESENKRVPHFLDSLQFKQPNQQ